MMSQIDQIVYLVLQYIFENGIYSSELFNTIKRFEQNPEILYSKVKIQGKIDRLNNDITELTDRVEHMSKILTLLEKNIE